MTAFIDFWGIGSRRLRRLTPPTRLACGMLILATCLVVPVCTAFGVSLILATICIWLALCGVPLRNIMRLSLYALVLFIPFFMLIPWIKPESASAYKVAEAATIPMQIAIRGTACIFVCAATIAVIDLSELNQALAGLKTPRFLSALIIQIVHQTAMLSNETKRMMAAIKTRGMPSKLSSKLRFSAALPTLWLLRVMNRAERVTAAMVLRDYSNVCHIQNEKKSGLDFFALACALSLFALSFYIKWVHL